MKASYTPQVSVTAQPAFYLQSRASWDNHYNILLVDLRHVDGYYLGAPYHFAMEGANASQVTVQASNAQEVLLIEIHGAQWQIDYKQVFPEWDENCNILLDSEEWLPMREGGGNKTYYIDFEDTLTFSADPGYKKFKISFTQNLDDQSVCFATSPHLIYRVSQQNRLQEIWILL